MAEAIEELDPTNEQVEPETTEAIEDTDTQPETEDEKKPEYTELERKLYARAKKAEAELKAIKAKEQPKLEVQPTNNAPTFVTQEQLDESILRTAKGYDDKALDQLKAIAKGKGITLTQAQEDDLFISYIERQKEEKRKTDAKLGASKGSGRTPKVDTTKPMTAEEHKAYWKEKMGR